MKGYPRPIVFTTAGWPPPSEPTPRPCCILVGQSVTGAVQVEIVAPNDGEKIVSALSYGGTDIKIAGPVDVGRAVLRGHALDGSVQDEVLIAPEPGKSTVSKLGWRAPPRVEIDAIATVTDARVSIGYGIAGLGHVHASAYAAEQRSAIAKARAELRVLASIVGEEQVSRAEAWAVKRDGWPGHGFKEARAHLAAGGTFTADGARVAPLRLSVEEIATTMQAIVDGQKTERTTR